MVKIDQHFDFTGSEPVMAEVYRFATTTTGDDISTEVQKRARLLFLDLIGVLAAGSQTELSRIICSYAADHHGAGGAAATIPFDGRRVSPSGAALAAGMTLDAIDAHDGHRLVKGHVGCAVLAALLACAEDLRVTDGRELLTSLVIGYQLGTRAGRALHEAPETGDEYHTSGVWSALAGVSAAYLARAGFTGAPVVSIERSHLQHYWNDLGRNWETLQQYVKPQPVCPWTQPATTAAEHLLRDHKIDTADITRIEIDTFEEATKLSQTMPTNTEEAQYNVPFPLATLLVRSQVGATEVTHT
ncbi:MAG: 2-methylcitrate dehydratase PrpD [Candidatus Poriferisodalaceae bacterium]|jgi:2-methylcitrate dehydratase PrpD